MKKVLMVLMAGLLVSMVWGCNNDDDESIPYEKSAELACEFLIDNSGTNDFEINFYKEEATDEEIKAAKNLCIKEITELPYCSDEYIATYSCEYAQANNNNKFLTKKMENALKECENRHKDCDKEGNFESTACRELMDCEIGVYVTMHPCGIAEANRDECESNEAIADAINNYIDDYRDQYTPHAY